jgi:hypothetical protein
MDKPMVIQDKKFALFGKPVDGGKGPPKMSFDVYRGNPSITVFTNDPNDPDGKPIKAKMDSSIFGTFIETVEQVIESEPGTQLRMVNRTGHPKKTFVDSITIIGKSAEGIIYIALNKEGKPTKRFNLMPTVYSDLADEQGNPVPDNVKSKLYAKGFFRQLREFVNRYVIDTYEPPQPQQQGQGGGSYNRGGGQSYGGGGGGRPAPAPAADNSFEDDLPM